MTTEEIPWEKIARQLIFQQLIDHPLPWKVERDWTYEVIASDGHIVAKCGIEVDAQAIVHLAELLYKELDDFDKLDKLATACREVAPTEDCDDIMEMPFEEALGYAFTLLLEHGIEDPQAFLRERHILE